MVKVKVHSGFPFEKAIFRTDHRPKIHQWNHTGLGLDQWPRGTSCFGHVCGGYDSPTALGFDFAGIGAIQFRIHGRKKTGFARHPTGNGTHFWESPVVDSGLQLRC